MIQRKTFRHLRNLVYYVESFTHNNLLCGLIIQQFLTLTTEFYGTKSKLLNQVPTVARARHFSYRTEDTYHNFIKRFILFHEKYHPKKIGASQITAFLTQTAIKENVCASKTIKILTSYLQFERFQRSQFSFVSGP